MPEPALVVENYSFWYKLAGGERVLALDDISFKIDKGDFVLILGPSGSGKSTLAFNLVGILPDYFGGYNQGRILVDHPDKGLVNRRELSAGERFSVVNMLFQNPEDQIVTLTVEEEIAFALENYRVPREDMPARIDWGLSLVGLQSFKERSTLKLSGGEKQRVALAAMLAMRPQVLILDEPTSNLDPAGTQEVLESVAHVRNETDTTMIIVEHEVDEVFHQVDKVVLVDGMKVHGPFTPRDFIGQHGLEVRDRMGLWIPQASEVGLELQKRGMELPTTPITPSELVTTVKDCLKNRQLAGQTHEGPPDNDRPARRRILGETVIKVRGLDFSYPTKSGVLKNIDLNVRKQELLAIVGQNGSGKSTLAALLNGLLKPSGGRVLVDGKQTNHYKFAELAKRVAYIFQVPEKQFVRNNVYDEMEHGLKALKVSKEERDRMVMEVLANVRLGDRKDISPYLLSHGQKRRLSVACMVIAKPEVVILDEPTFGQDWQHARGLMDYMRELADSGAAVTFITHDMRLVAEYADRCVAMSDGELIFDGTPMEMFSSPEVIKTARLKPPPIYDFSQELVGEPVLGTDELIRRLEEQPNGRPRTLV
jgi:energy-coupling factor transporter ATP-binding protein EcfA2